MSTMFDLVKTSLVSSLILASIAGPALASDRPFNLGKIATAEEVSGWDIDVRPDGLGAPVGMGNAIDGEEIYADRCAACHGDFGEAVDRWPVLVGGEGKDHISLYQLVRCTSLSNVHIQDSILLSCLKQIWNIILLMY